MGMGTSSGRSGSRAVMSEINVTPFVDVMLVLLIIFMVTTPLMQQGLDVNLPKTATTGIEPQGEDSFVLIINSRGIIKAGEIEVGVDQLREKLKAIFQTRKNKQIYIQADEKVDYGVVAKAMTEVRLAGISNINLITIPKD